MSRDVKEEQKLTRWKGKGKVFWAEGPAAFTRSGRQEAASPMSSESAPRNWAHCPRPGRALCLCRPLLRVPAPSSSLAPHPRPQRCQWLLVYCLLILVTLWGPHFQIKKSELQRRRLLSQSHTTWQSQNWHPGPVTVPSCYIRLPLNGVPTLTPVDLKPGDPDTTFDLALPCRANSGRLLPLSEPQSPHL